MLGQSCVKECIGGDFQYGSLSRHPNKLAGVMWRVLHSPKAVQWSPHLLADNYDMVLVDLPPSDTMVGMCPLKHWSSYFICDALHGKRHVQEGFRSKDVSQAELHDVCLVGACQRIPQLIARMVI